MELADLVVAFVGDILDLEFLAFVDVEDHADSVLDDRVVGHFDVHVHVGEAFLFEIVLDALDRGGLDVFGELAAAAEVKALLDVVALAVLDAAIVPGNDAGTLLKVEAEPGGIARGVEGIHIEAQRRGCALHPDAFDGGGNIVARDGDFIAGMDS